MISYDDLEFNDLHEDISEDFYQLDGIDGEHGNLYTMYININKRYIKNIHRVEEENRDIMVIELSGNSEVSKYIHKLKKGHDDAVEQFETEKGTK